MIRIIFDFEPVAAQTIATTMSNEGQLFEGNQGLAQEFIDLVYNFTGTSAGAKGDFKIIQTIGKKIEQGK